MFTMPSIWNLVVSTIVFFVAAWYIHRYLAGQAMPKGMTRSLLVFTLASVVSWVSGEAVDWVQVKIDGPQAAVQQPADLSQLLKAAGQAQQ